MYSYYHSELLFSFFLASPLFLSLRKIFGYEQDLRADASRPRWVSRDVDGQAGIKHRPALASMARKTAGKKIAQLAAVRH